MVEETLNVEENLPEKISILRLDTDFYESTKELEFLFSRLVNGGMLIDDYGDWSGSKKATDEFLKKRDLKGFYVNNHANGSLIGIKLEK